MKWLRNLVCPETYRYVSPAPETDPKKIQKLRDSDIPGYRWAKAKELKPGDIFRLETFGNPVVYIMEEVSPIFRGYLMAKMENSQRIVFWSEDFEVYIRRQGTAV